MNDKYIAEQARSDLEQANEANAALTNQIVKISKANDRIEKILHSKLRDKNDIIFELQREVKSQQRQITKLNMRCSDSASYHARKELIVMLRNDIEMLKNRYVQLECQNIKLINQNLDLSDKLDKMQKTVKMLED